MDEFSSAAFCRDQGFGLERRPSKVCLLARSKSFWLSISLMVTFLWLASFYPLPELCNAVDEWHLSIYPSL